VARAADVATLVHHGIAGARARTLRDTLASSGAATFVFARDAIVHDPAGEDFVGYVSTWSTAVTCVESVADHAAWAHDDGITATVSVGTQAQIDLARDGIRTSLRDAAHVVSFPIWRLPGMWGLMARSAGGTKGSACVGLRRIMGAAWKRLCASAIG
jgi:hypothetical protein